MIQGKYKSPEAGRLIVYEEYQGGQYGGMSKQRGEEFDLWSERYEHIERVSLWWPCKLWLNFYADCMHHAIVWSSSLSSILSCLQPLLSHCKHITFIPKTLYQGDCNHSQGSNYYSSVKLFHLSIFSYFFPGCGIWTAINSTIAINSTFWKIFMDFLKL